MRRFRILLMSVAVVVLGLCVAAGAQLTPELQDQLAKSKYVYISTARKNGSFGKPAEIWFLFHNGSVYVASPPTTFRVRRIKAGRNQARIAAGKPDGPSFVARGAVVNEPDMYPILFDTYAKKYPDGWGQFEQKFKTGLKDGSRLLIKYTPTGAVTPAAGGKE